MSDRTIYVYDQNTGKVQYTVEEASDAQVENFNKKNIPVFISTKRYRTLGTYVNINANTSSPVSIDPIEYMDFISIDKSILVANGTDEVAISGLRNGMYVDINGEGSYIVSEDTGTTLEVSADGFSYDSKYNTMIIKFRKYGCHDSQLRINLTEGE